MLPIGLLGGAGWAISVGSVTIGVGQALEGVGLLRGKK